MTCIICNNNNNNTLRINSEDRDSIPKGLYYEGVLVDIFCPECNSRSRIRQLSSVLDGVSHFAKTAAVPLNTMEEALLICSPPQERKIISSRYTVKRHVCFAGSHGDKTIELGVDICAFGQNESDKYDAIFAIGVVDYIPNIYGVIEGFSRKLQAGGTAFVYLQPWRLTIAAEATLVEIQQFNALAHEAYANSSGPFTGIPTCKFSVPKLRDLSLSFNITMQYREFNDPNSDLKGHWLLFTKN